MHTKYNEKYTRELLTDAVTSSVGVAGVLRYLEIPWSGGTHAHISRRIKQFGIDTSHFKRVAPNKVNWLDNRRENLRFLRPNCHSQTPTFAGKLKDKKGS
jgi:hypothetical protein